MKSMKTIIYVLLSASMILASGSALAKKKKKKKKRASASSGEYQAPYGMAGCGLGSLLIKEDGMIQIVAATLNGTGYQTFGISTGSSNCVAVKEDLALQEREVYLFANMNSLSKEVAQGDGEHLKAFAEVIGCGGQQTYPDFVETSRLNYEQIFTSDNPRTVLDNYLRVIKGNSNLAQNCQRLG